MTLGLYHLKKFFLSFKYINFYVKKTYGGTTSVDISVLEGDRKLKAIAELAGGEVTEESLKFAPINFISVKSTILIH